MTRHLCRPTCLATLPVSLKFKIMKFCHKIKIKGSNNDTIHKPISKIMKKCQIMPPFPVFIVVEIRAQLRRVHIVYCDAYSVPFVNISCHFRCFPNKTVYRDHICDSLNMFFDFSLIKGHKMAKTSKAAILLCSQHATP